MFVFVLLYFCSTVSQGTEGLAFVHLSIAICQDHKMRMNHYSAAKPTTEISRNLNLIIIQQICHLYTSQRIKPMIMFILFIRTKN